jgi:hypothetical protein
MYGGSGLKSQFEGPIDLSDARGSSTDLDQCFLTRSQAVLTLCYVADIADDVAATAIVDGYDDNGIDAIYFDEDLGEVCVVRDARQSPEYRLIELGSANRNRKYHLARLVYQPACQRGSRLGRDARYPCERQRLYSVPPFFLPIIGLLLVGCFAGR